MKIHDLDDPLTQPHPKGGWSESLSTLNDMIVVPPTVSSMVQDAGLLHPNGSYCPEGALWRRYRPITEEPAWPSETKRITGRWLWGGVLWAHFGHFLVESTSRLWALAELDQPVDGVLFIPKRPRVGDETRGFQREFVSLMQKDLPIRVAAEPSQVEELVVPGQGFGLGQITLGTKKYRSAIQSQFGTEVAPDGPEKIYISRSKLGLRKGGLLGEEKMEEYLEAEGYEIFHPQEHSLSVQLARYKAAKQVIAADGSALHLYAMVGRPDQNVAMILRRMSGANTLLSDNVSSFCKRDPVIINALRAEWLPVEKQTSNRLSFGEIDHGIVSRDLAANGFLPKGTEWPVLDEAQRQQALDDKGLRKDRFVESTREMQEAKMAVRAARRAEREAQEQSQA